MVLARGRFSQRRAARGGALYANYARRAAVRGDDRGCERIHASVEDEHGAVPTARSERAVDGIQVRGDGGGDLPGAPAEETARQALGRRHDHSRCYTQDSAGGQALRALGRQYRAGPDKREIRGILRFAQNDNKATGEAGTYGSV